MTRAAARAKSRWPGRTTPPRSRYPRNKSAMGSSQVSRRGGLGTQPHRIPIKSEGKKSLPELIKLPLYGYRCNQCGYGFDKIQKFDDQPETVCPKCSGEMSGPLTAPSLQFKGAGWYVNDY